MAATLTPDRHRTPGPSRTARRVGYVIAAVLNAVFLWVTHQLLGWGWPGFLTEEFDRVLPCVTVSFVVSIVANLWFVHDDCGWPKPLGDLAVAIAGFVAARQTWVVFPFDFSDGTDWSWAVRTVIVVGLVGTAIGIVVRTARLIGQFGERPSGV